MRSLTFLLLASSTTAFTQLYTKTAFTRTPLYATVEVDQAPTPGLEQATTVETATQVTYQISQAEEKPSPNKKPVSKGHKEGVLSPMVLFVKGILGDETLNKVRGKVIAMHSDVIGSFVDTAETAFGDAVLRSLFRLADKNRDGLISEDELSTALQSLGFSWLQEKQVKGIFKRADLDENGALDMEEWIKESPKTLRTNLIKLAKKNGGDMGLLS